MLFPVVPLRVKEFMLTTLCKKCGEMYTSDENSRVIRECSHEPNERGWVATITHIELDLALEHGYTVTKFYAAYHWDEWTSELFRGYVRRFLEIKVHADGWPPGIETDEQKYGFIDEYKERFGVILDYSKFIRNEPLRQIAKLSLNNLFGKFGMRNDLSKTLITSDPLELEKIASGDRYIFNSVDLLNDDNSVMIVYSEIDEFIKEHNCSNVVLALFTTSAARVKLYSAMDTIAKINEANGNDESKRVTLGYTDTGMCYQLMIKLNFVIF